MFAMLRNFLIQRKKKKLRNRNVRRHAVLPDSVQDELPMTSMETVTPVPFWYAEHGSFEDVEFVFPSDVMGAPVVQREMRNALKRYIADICPKPDGSMQIYSKLNQPDTSVKEITALVTTDPMLAAQILKFVNSATFGVAQEVTSVGRAVTLLGFQNVKSVVLNHSVRRGTSGVQNELTIRIREHSHMSSAIAYHLAETVDGVDQFTASTIALLHDMGKILYPMIVKKGRGLNFISDVPLQVIESLVTSVFAEIWELPPTICAVLEYIHHPYFYPLSSVPSQYRSLVTTLSMANLLTNVMGFGDGESNLLVKKEFLDEIRQVDSPARWMDDKMAAKIESTRGVL